MKPRKRGFDHEDGSCMECRDGHAVERSRKSDRKRFFGCTNFPRCTNSEPLEKPWGWMDDDDAADLRYAFED